MQYCLIPNLFDGISNKYGYRGISSSIYFGIGETSLRRF